VAKKTGIIRFLGTNCETDVLKWVENSGKSCEYLWFQNQFNVNDFEQIILPGGFSYGDYLRCGAMAARTPVMKSVIEFEKKGKPILGICNGFQILCEAGLLPGVLIQNKALKFKDEWTQLNVKNNKNFFGAGLQKDQVIHLPIAHGDGRFYHSADGLKKIQDQNQIWLTYENNPNGALMNIAGVVSESGNVFGLMPHPERAVYQWMGSTDGQYFLC
jgi:phosphoribosylformylglycinamidine synthase I